MPVKILAEIFQQAGDTDLGTSLAFSVENVGDVPAWLRFTEAGYAVQLPVGMTREFPYMGDSYDGKLYITFGVAGEGQATRVNVLKNTHYCKPS